MTRRFRIGALQSVVARPSPGGVRQWMKGAAQ
jgi:hypothetical protein